MKPLIPTWNNQGNRRSEALFSNEKLIELRKLILFKRINRVFQRELSKLSCSRNASTNECTAITERSLPHFPWQQLTVPHSGRNDCVHFPLWCVSMYLPVKAPVITPPSSWPVSDWSPDPIRSVVITFSATDVCVACGDHFFRHQCVCGVWWSLFPPPMCVWRVVITFSATDVCGVPLCLPRKNRLIKANKKDKHSSSYLRKEKIYTVKTTTRFTPHTTWHKEFNEIGIQEWHVTRTSHAAPGPLPLGLVLISKFNFKIWNFHTNVFRKLSSLSKKSQRQQGGSDTLFSYTHVINT